jgi:hypothetical protein
LIDDTYTDLFSGEARTASRLDDRGFQHLVDTTRRIAEIARTDYGLQLVFHPHAQTHVEYEVSAVSACETDRGFSGTEEFWIIVAIRSEDETETRAGESAGRADRQRHPARDAPTFFG